MKEIPLGVGVPSRLIDVCTSCHFVWFDRGEFEALPKLDARKPPGIKFSPEEIEALALERLAKVKDKQYDDETSPDHWWEILPALFGVPIEYNRTPLKHRPVATWLLAAVIVAVSIATFRNLTVVVKGWGLVPAEFGRHFGLTFVTSFFLHGGLIHLFGNLYYLIVFGDNTEDVLGKARYLFLISLASIAGDFAHILSNLGSTTPCVGASGGISGVLAYYCLRFPHARVGIIFWFRWFRIPVGGMFALWILLQIITAIQQSAGFGRVAVLAHLGGAAVGVLFWLFTRQSFSEAEERDVSAPK
ncbi:MAG: rhomboid family intramembrane serine protease [Phycisphaerales bacterium]|nr:MAG: rhomboid family intramembrane serine protease [Phycisphaerales bacterium]UCG50327.1 MAG: rhomboid family intramembrane serine protease [Phycisphaerales bacterium]